MQSKKFQALNPKCKFWKKKTPLNFINLVKSVKRKIVYISHLLKIVATIFKIKDEASKFYKRVFEFCLLIDHKVKRSK